MLRNRRLSRRLFPSQYLKTVTSLSKPSANKIFSPPLLNKLSLSSHALNMTLLKDLCCLRAPIIVYIDNKETWYCLKFLSLIALKHIGSGESKRASVFWWSGFSRGENFKTLNANITQAKSWLHRICSSHSKKQCSVHQINMRPKILEWISSKKLSRTIWIFTYMMSQSYDLEKAIS